MNMSPVMVKLFFCDALTAMGQDGNTDKTFFCWSCHYSQRGCETLQVSTGFGRPLFEQISLRTVCRMGGYSVSPSSSSLHVIQIVGSTFRDVYASEPIIIPIRYRSLGVSVRKTPVTRPGHASRTFLRLARLFIFGPSLRP